MISHDPLQQLRDLDRTSPQFHEKLSNFFHGNVYESIFPDLERDSLAWFVEYLDSVSSHWSVLHCAVLRAVVGLGSCRYFQPCNPDIPGILA